VNGLNQETNLFNIFKGVVRIEYFYKVCEGKLPKDYGGNAPEAYKHPSISDTENIKHTIL